MSQLIPKKIHFCWFGGKPLSEETKKYIESWKVHCPDYEIIEWNETNFDINSNNYVKEAYEAKKWAFVTDYVRLYVLYNEGGIYMDTDVEVLKKLDQFLVHDAFSGFETEKDIPTGIMGSRKELPLFKKLLEYYDNRHFIKQDGSYDMTTNVSIISDICKQYGLKRNNKLQNIEGFVLYPSDYFCPKSHDTGKIDLTSNTVTIHHFAGSWLSIEAQKRINLSHYLCNKFGKKVGSFMFNTLCLPYRLFSNLRELGIKNCIRKIFKKG